MMLAARRALLFRRTHCYLALRLLINFIPWLLHLLIADLLLSALLPLATVFPNWTYNVASSIAGPVWRGIQQICKSNGAVFTFSGDQIPHGESAIVVANHVEWADFYLIQELASRAGMLSRCRWFAKKQLRWVPFLGWGLWAMGMPLVSRKWTEDKREMDRLFQGVKDGSWPMWLISYSEATRYTPEKHAQAVQWCQANGKPVPQHTLYPRTKGFVSTVQHLRESSHVKAVYDITIAYADDRIFMSPPSFFETIYHSNLKSRYRLHAHVRRFELESLPESSNDLAQWLEERWMEKGVKLGVLKKQLANGDVW
ncbi:hypothetical protein MBLNU459_g5436t2 [Dothideomycetes sp. NU459]